MKKATISIFVSGTKRLKEQRMSLKVLANDMNGEYRKNGVDIILNMYSYLNFGTDEGSGTLTHQLLQGRRPVS